ncbi:hypothetical protein DFH06DRAFT_1153953 [Mycena polygramma]|nr:hypothetical protein DFH06DRAFT_1153953 [Mycena polygramma]
MAPGTAGDTRNDDNQRRMNPLYGRTRSDDEIQRLVRVVRQLDIEFISEFVTVFHGVDLCDGGRHRAQYMRDRETRAGATKPAPSLLSRRRDTSLSLRPDTPSRFPCPLKIAVEVEWEAEGGARMLGNAVRAAKYDDEDVSERPKRRRNATTRIRHVCVCAQGHGAAVSIRADADKRERENEGGVLGGKRDTATATRRDYGALVETVVSAQKATLNRHPARGAEGGEHAEEGERRCEPREWVCVQSPEDWVCASIWDGDVAPRQDVRDEDIQGMSMADARAYGNSEKAGLSSKTEYRCAKRTHERAGSMPMPRRNAETQDDTIELGIHPAARDTGADKTHNGIAGDVRRRGIEGRRGFEELGAKTFPAAFM